MRGLPLQPMFEIGFSLFVLLVLTVIACTAMAAFYFGRRS